MPIFLEMEMKNDSDLQILHSVNPYNECVEASGLLEVHTQKHLACKLLWDSGSIL